MTILHFLTTRGFGFRSFQEVQRKEQYIEDRKDKRTKLHATQQSELIDQRKNDLLPKDFENPDNLGGFGMEQFAQ